MNQTPEKGSHVTDLTLRHIQEKDNEGVASLIRTTLKEFGLDKPGTVYYDKETDNLFSLFQTRPKSVYYVAIKGNSIVGGGGVFPSAGLPVDTCELVKMYVLPEFRGKGLGKLLLQKCIDFATAVGYSNIYLETMPELSQALKVYERFGFQYLKHPLGNTGHFGCDLWMLKSIDSGGTP